MELDWVDSNASNRLSPYAIAIAPIWHGSAHDGVGFAA